jgi:phenylalanyl-tRNA synthetase beta chain
MTDILEKALRTVLKYDPPSPFPAVLRDLAVIVREDVDYEDFVNLIRSSGKLLQKIELFDVYRGKGVEKGHKSLAMHLEFGLEDKTLTAEEADKEVAVITKELTKKFNAKIRG